MISHWFRRDSIIVFAFVATAIVGQAQPNREPPLPTPRSSSATREAATSTRSTSSTRAAAAAKGALPDPTLLDGSAFEEEKRAEYGMLGEFEMPGSDSRDAERVGGNEEPKVGASDGQSAQLGAGAIPGSSGGGQTAGSSPGNSDAESGKTGAAEGSGQGEGQQASANGTQGSGAGETSKPGEIGIGDSALQIQTLPATTPGVVGVTNPAQPQQPPSQGERAAGGGGKNSGGPNRGVEKGRTMPPGM